MDTFWGIPQYIWEGIFTLLEVLLIGGVAGAFISSYQKRKEVLLRIKGEIMMRRMTAYEGLEEMIEEVYLQIAPPVEEEAVMAELLDGIPIEHDGYDYPSLFESEQHFDAFYSKLSAVHRKNHVYLDGPLLETVGDMMSYLSEVKLLLDAYCDTEHTDVYMKNKKDADRKIQAAYRLFGVLLMQDMIRFYALMDQRIAHDMRHIRLSYRDYKWRKWLDRRVEDLYLWAEKHRRVDGQNSWIVQRLLNRRYGHSPLFLMPQYFIVLLFRIHCTNERWEDLTEKMSDAEREAQLAKFHNIFIRNYHVR